MKIDSHSTLDPQVARPSEYEAIHVLWEYGYHDRTCSGGGFVASLVHAISKADNSNRARLALGFPGYVAACNLIERDPTGLDALRKIAGVSS